MVHHFFAPPLPSLSEKRRIKNAKSQEKSKMILAFPSWRRGNARAGFVLQGSSYPLERNWKGALLRREEGLLKRKTSRGKSDLKENKAQENCCNSTVGRELRIPSRGQRSWKNHNCWDDNLRESGHLRPCRHRRSPLVKSRCPAIHGSVI